MRLRGKRLTFDVERERRGGEQDEERLAAEHEEK